MEKIRWDFRNIKGLKLCVVDPHNWKFLACLQDWCIIWERSRFCASWDTYKCVSAAAWLRRRWFGWQLGCSDSSTCTWSARPDLHWRESSTSTTSQHLLFGECKFYSVLDFQFGINDFCVFLQSIGNRFGSTNFWCNLQRSRLLKACKCHLLVKIVFGYNNSI